MKKSKVCWWSALISYLTLVACSHHAALRERLDRGRGAFARGEVLEAYALLADSEVREAATDPKVADLLKQVTAATEYLAARWLEKADYWLGRGNLLKAIEYLEDIASRLPPGDGLRQELENRAGPVREKLELAQKELEVLNGEARRLFRQGQVEEARRNLAQAYLLAQKNQLPFELEAERLLEECNRRLPTAAPEGLPPELFLTPPEKKPATPLRKEPPADRPVRPKAPPEPPREEKASLQLGDRLTRAVEMLRRQEFIEAIEVFREVLKLDPANREAQAALEELEPKRQHLIREFLSEADKHFTNQELDKAVPFWEKVLRLDPGNRRAKEGLEMYRRLEELKHRQPAPKTP